MQKMNSIFPTKAAPYAQLVLLSKHHISKEVAEWMRFAKKRTISDLRTILTY